MNTGFMKFRNGCYVSASLQCLFSAETFCLQLSSQETVDLPAASRTDQIQHNMAGNKTVDTEKLGTVFPESTPSVSSRLKAFRRQFHTVRATAGDTVHLPCRLSPETSTAAREVRWFKRTECIEVFQVTVGSGCEGSGKLTLRDVKVTDSGQYRCKMLGEKKEEMSVIHLRVSEFKLVSRPEDVGKPSHVEPLKPTSKQQSSPDFGPHVFCGHDVTLPCYLSPETSAAAMEIRWFKGTDCIYLYLNGQVTEGRGYEGRVSMFTDELQRGNVSLSLRDVQRSDYGEYRCEVTHGGHRVKNDGVRIKGRASIILNIWSFSELNLRT
ncbi:hypothetical protein SRHO_G00049340 [Serrasalmus rhombeus]